MPGITVQSVLDEARGTYLNDAGGTLYTNAVLLPHIKTAYENLRNEMALNDIPTLNARTVDQTITAGSVALSSVPSDLLVPVFLEERTPNSTELYQPMYQRTWEPNQAQGTNLRFWDWRQEAIGFLGATTDRAVRVHYLSDLNPAAIAAGSTLTAMNARSYLSARVGALAAMFIMHNADIAQACNMVADAQLAKCVKIAIKERQGLPTRRKPFLGPRRAGTP